MAKKNEIPHNLDELIAQEISGWMQTGIEDWRDLLADPAVPPADHLKDHLTHLHTDGPNVVAVDKAGTVYMFRMRLERL